MMNYFSARFSKRAKSSSEPELFVVLGATGNVGSKVATLLLNMKKPVRVVLREGKGSEAKTQKWKDLGADVVFAGLTDEAALRVAFEGATSAFVLSPPAYNLPDAEEAAKNVNNCLSNVIKATKSLKHVVCLSSIGAQISDLSVAGSVAVLNGFEEAMFSMVKAKKLSTRITTIRAPFFVENFADERTLDGVFKNNTLFTLLQPSVKELLCGSTVDIANLVVQEFLRTPAKREAQCRAVEMTNCHKISLESVADVFAKLSGKKVKVISADPASFEALLGGENNQNMSKKNAWLLASLYTGINDNKVRSELDILSKSSVKHENHEVVKSNCDVQDLVDAFRSNENIKKYLV